MWFGHFTTLQRASSNLLTDLTRANFKEGPSVSKKYFFKTYMKTLCGLKFNNQLPITGATRHIIAATLRQVGVHGPLGCK